MRSMAEKDTLSFSESHIKNLIDSSPFSTITLSSTAKQQNEADKLTRLHKKHIRTELHGHFLLKHLRGGTIPWGLQVKNIPVIFTEDIEYRKGFSYINTKCSRDLMVHTIETAQRICSEEEKEIEELTKAINDNHTVTEAKTLLDKIEKEVQTFKDYTINVKSTQFERDSKAFKIEQVYPFLKEDFYTSGDSRGALRTYQGRSRNRFLTFSDTTSSDSSSDSRQDNTKKRGTGSAPFLARGGRSRVRFKQPWDMRTRSTNYNK